MTLEEFRKKLEFMNSTQVKRGERDYSQKGVKNLFLVDSAFVRKKHV